MLFTVAGFLLVVLAASASSASTTVKRGRPAADWSDRSPPDKDSIGALSNLTEDPSSGRSSTLLEDTSSGRLMGLDTDIQEAVDVWSRYRNIVKDGFFVNDSMIVLADDDYYSDEEGGENSHENISQDKGEVFDDRKENSDPFINNTFDSEGIVNEPEDADIGMKTNGLEQGGFKATLTGMMTALAEIQSKGDLMMGAIRTQRQLLYGVKGEVEEAVARLVVVRRRKEEEEERRREAKVERLEVEEKTRVIQLERQELEVEVEQVEREREEEEHKLLDMRRQVEAVQQHVLENSLEMNRLEGGLSPLVDNLATRRAQLADLERGVQGKEHLLKSFQEKIEVSQAILSELEAQIGQADKTEIAATSSSLLLPAALLVSSLFNILTGGHIVSTFLSFPASSKMDNSPLQFSPAPGPSSYFSSAGSPTAEDSSREGEEQRFQDVNTQDSYYSLPRSLQQQVF